MVGINYVAGSLNRTKKKAANHSDPHNTAVRPRGRPLFARPLPLNTRQTNPQSGLKGYIDTANLPDSSSPPRRSDQAAAGRSGIEGITFPWAIEARELYLEEKRLDEMRRRPYQDDEDGEDTDRDLRKYEMRIYRAQREKAGVMRRGRRRWWESYSSVANVNTPIEMDTEEESAELHASEDVSKAPNEAAGARRTKYRKKNTTTQIDQKRRVFVDLLEEHDLLHLRKLKDKEREADNRNDA